MGRVIAKKEALNIDLWKPKIEKILNQILKPCNLKDEKQFL